MADQAKPIWEQIGSSFIQHYYQVFDTDRSQLGAIYVSATFCVCACLLFGVLFADFSFMYIYIFVVDIFIQLVFS